MEPNKNKRMDEKIESPSRSGRFYSVASEWFFSVREQEDQGPYDSKQVAEQNLKIYLLVREHMSSNKTKQNYMKLV